MNRIDKKFKELKQKKQKAFIAFITSGYPNLNTTKKLVLEFDKSGVDVVELGVPFSDPMADGPVIQEASSAALKKNINLNDILRLVKDLRKATQIPICLMTYYNPIFCFGDEKFLKAASGCGVDGVIIPDLPPEEGKSFIRLANKHRIDVICFIAPTTSRQRIKRVSSLARGFIYYVSLTGVTGARRELPKDLVNNLKLIKRITNKSVCVGFGISNPKQVKQVQRVADGVIIGSAIVRKIKDNIGKRNLIGRVADYISYLKS